MKHYTSAPLPFQGQKRRFLKPFKEAMKNFDNATVFIDLFGGSGLLSHTAKHLRPDALVIYNDFDEYHKRLEAIPQTNMILDKLRELTKHCKEDKKLPEELKQQIVAYLKAQEQKHGYIDYITISSSLLFSMNYSTSLEGFEKSTLYNCVRKSGYNANGYLDGLYVVKEDYQTLFKKYHNNVGVVFIVDPPYLSTDVGTYKNYWRLSQYLDVLNVLKNNSYFYFTSDKSSIIELCEWLEKNLKAINPFHGSTKHEMKVHVNHNAGYNDIMLYKNVNTTAPIEHPIYYSTSTNEESSL
jgi:16S rRNA G966 N2-methylase RsmD